MNNNNNNEENCGILTEMRELIHRIENLQNIPLGNLLKIELPGLILDAKRIHASLAIKNAVDSAIEQIRNNRTGLPQPIFGPSADQIENKFCAGPSPSPRLSYEKTKLADKIAIETDKMWQEHLKNGYEQDYSTALKNCRLLDLLDENKALTAELDNLYAERQREAFYQNFWKRTK